MPAVKIMAASVVEAVDCIGIRSTLFFCLAEVCRMIISKGRNISTCIMQFASHFNHLMQM